MHDLGTLGGFHSFATDINSAGQVTGYADLTGSQTWHAFLWTPGEGMQDLGTLDGGVYSYGRAMNDVAQILGTSASATGGSTMFLWSPDRGMQDLPSLGVPGQSIDLNNAGQIVGAADFGGERHPFLWTPGAGTRDLGSLGG
jgi:probable HAF family extracellular repeat protein